MEAAGSENVFLFFHISTNKNKLLKYGIFLKEKYGIFYYLIAIQNGQLFKIDKLMYLLRILLSEYSASFPKWAVNQSVVTMINYIKD